MKFFLFYLMGIILYFYFRDVSPAMSMLVAANWITLPFAKVSLRYALNEDYKVKLEQYRN